MAIAFMQKVMIVAHRSQASDLLAALQDAGIVQILDAERAMVSKEWPELMVDNKRRREIGESIDRLGKAVDFLKPYAGKGQTSLFAPYIEVDAKTYQSIVTEKEPLALLSQTESIGSRMEKLAAEADSRRTLLAKLMPWQSLSIPVEQLGGLSTTVIFAGLIPDQHREAVREKMNELGAVYQKVADYNSVQACIIAAFNESSAEVQKVLRSAEFEPAVFEGLTGTVAQNISQIQTRLDEIQKEQLALKKKAAQLADNKFKLQVLFDHYQNLNSRMNTESTAPATDNVVFFEGWVKKKDYIRLEKLVSPFDACAVAPVQPGEEEEEPVEIENAQFIRPFETVTRLYGMPIPSSIDPTVFLAPFFAIFFGLCIADGGYGLILVALLAWAIKKAQGDKKMLWMLLVCSIATTLAGAITGGWFGDSITSLLGPDNVLEKIRVKIMLFDPMTQPMAFFLLSLGMGYFQIQFGLFIAFFANLKKKDIAAAIWDQLTWIIHLNTLLCLGLSAGGILPASLSRPCGIIAILTSLAILLFTARGVAWGGRIGLGVYQLFSTVFYMGDVLSYARLMALGMVGAGFGMAINVLVKLIAEVPYVGWLLGALLFVGGHLFNIALSVLGAFVHTMRLQFVEFFPKFFTGGGRDFIPLQNEYKHIQVK